MTTSPEVADPECARDGASPVRLGEQLGGTVAAGPDLLDDRHRVLTAGVVRGEHRDVGEPSRDRAHEGTFRPVPVSPATEDDDHLAPCPGGFGTGRPEHLSQGGGRVGIVHEHGRTEVVRHDLEPARGTVGRRESGRDRGSGHAERPGGGGCGQGVTDVDLSTWADPDRGAVEAEVTLLQADFEPLGVGERERPRGDLGALEQALPERVVCVDHAPAGVLRREEPGLGREVGLHAPVVVEMVLAQVREDGNVVDIAIEPVLGQRVRGHFERHGATLSVSGAGESALQVRCLGRRSLSSERADDGGRPAVLLEHRAEEEGRRRLAVRARHPDGSQRRGRVVEEGTRRESHGRASSRLTEDQLHCAAGVLAERALADEGHRSGPPRRRSEDMPVDVVSRDAAVQRTGAHVAMVVGDRGDDEVGRVPDHKARPQPLDKLGKTDLGAGSDGRGLAHVLPGAVEPGGSPSPPVGAMSKWCSA